MLKTGRRGFLGIFGAGAISAPFIAADVAGNESARALNLISGRPSGGSLVPSGAGNGWSLFHKLAQNTYERRRERHFAQTVTGGFDPDIAVLHSIAPNARVRMQHRANRRHERETETLLEMFRRKAGVKDD